jgi:hypothetical protein
MAASNGRPLFLTIFRNLCLNGRNSFNMTKALLFLLLLTGCSIARMPREDQPESVKIQLGSFPTIYAILREYTERNIIVSGPAAELLYAVNLKDKPKSCTVTALTTLDLGYPRGANFDTLYDKAISMGYSVCPIEVALHLRLRAEEQMPGTTMIVVSEPLSYGGKRNFFALGHSTTENGTMTSKLCLGLVQMGLRGVGDSLNNYVTPNEALVFAKK